jgi:hypothetical protein
MSKMFQTSKTKTSNVVGVVFERQTRSCHRCEMKTAMLQPNKNSCIILSTFFKSQNTDHSLDDNMNLKILYLKKYFSPNYRTKIIISFYHKKS